MFTHVEALRLHIHNTHTHTQTHTHTHTHVHTHCLHIYTTHNCLLAAPHNLLYFSTQHTAHNSFHCTAPSSALQETNTTAAPHAQAQAHTPGGGGGDGSLPPAGGTEGGELPPVFALLKGV